MNTAIKWFLDKFGIKIVMFIFNFIKRFSACLICGIIGGSSVVCVLGIWIYTYKHFTKAHAIRNFQAIIEKQKSLVDDCKTQNCLGIAEIETKGIRFAQIWCKDSANSELKELTHIKGHWYSNEYIKQIDKQGDLYGILHILPTNEIIGIIPQIFKRGDRCEYDMYVAHTEKQYYLSSNPRLMEGEGNLLQSNIKIPFFTEQVFPNLNTKCNPKYNSLYAETDFKIIWITHYEMQYFLWWSFADEGKCHNMATRQDIFVAIQDLSNKLGENYTKIDFKKFIGL